MSASRVLVQCFLSHPAHTYHFLNFTYLCLADQQKLRNKFILQKQGLKIMKAVFKFINHEYERIEHLECELEMEEAERLALESRDK